MKPGAEKDAFYYLEYQEKLSFTQAVGLMLVLA